MTTMTQTRQALPTKEVLVDLDMDTTAHDKSDGVAIVSGGMDSITLVHYLVNVHEANPHLVSFDYGQRHKKELEFARRCAERLGLRWSLIDLSSLTDHIASSALTHGTEVPDGHYAEDNMALTVVPNRNMTMMSIAGSIAVSKGYRYLAAGMHAGDHAQYPDCRWVFVNAFTACLKEANVGFIHPNFEVLTPFLDRSKAEIAQQAYQFDVPIHETWSCYKGGEVHCGKCGTCVERLEAIDSVGDANWDTTQYADNNFWREAVAEYRRSM